MCGVGIFFLRRWEGKHRCARRQTRYAFRMSAEVNREALRQVCRTPGLLAMELLWRWSFGLGVLGLLLTAWTRLRPVLMLDEAELRTLDTSNPVTLASQIVALFEPYAPLLLRVALWVAAGAALLWIVTATVGRTVITRIVMSEVTRLQNPTSAGSPALDSYRRSAVDSARPNPAQQNLAMPYPAGKSSRWPAHAILHAARVLMLLIPAIGYLAGVLLASLAGGAENPLSAAILVLTPFFTACVLWSLVNWVLSLAPLFVEREGLGALDAIVAALNFVQRRRTELASIAQWNGALRTVVAVALTVLGAATLSAGGPLWLRVALVALETLAYLVLSDWLLLARLAAYAQVAVAEPLAR